MAGRTFTHQFGAAPNLHYSFTWDGIDAYGRATAGTQPVTIRLGYRYGVVKYDEPRTSLAAFGAVGGAAFEGARGRMNFYRGDDPRRGGGVRRRLGRARRRAWAAGRSTRTTSTTRARARCTWATAGARGRADHHRSRARVSRRQFAGQGDGGQATAARLGYANDVGRGRTGRCSSPRSLAQRRPHAAHPARRRDRDLASGIGSPRGIASGRDGSLYVTRPNLGTMRPGRARPDRHPFAGGGSGARRRRPRHERALPLPIEVAAAPDGSVYIADGERASARRARRHPHHRRRRRLRPPASATAGLPPQAAARLRQRHRRLARGRAVHRPPGQRLRRRRPDPPRRRRRHDHDRGRRRARPGHPGDGGPGTQATIGVPAAWTSAPTGPVLRGAARRRPRPPARPDGMITTSPAAARTATATAATAGPPCAPLGSAQASRSRRTAPCTSATTASENFSGFVRRVAGRCRSARARCRPPTARGVRVRRRGPSPPHASTASPAGRCSPSPTTAQGRLTAIADGDGNVTPWSARAASSRSSPPAGSAPS